MNYKNIITGNHQKMSFTVIDNVVMTIGNKYKSLLYVDNFCIKKSEENINQPIYINYSSSLVKLGEIKSGDKLNITAKISINEDFNELNDVVFDLRSITKSSIDAFDDSKRKLIPKNKELLVGKIMSEHKNDYSDKQDFDLLVNDYLHWAKYAKHSNDQILHDAFSLNTKYTFVAKVKGKIKNGSENPSLVNSKNVSLMIVKELTTNDKIRVNAIINNPSDLNILGSLHVGDQIRFDAFIKEKNLSKRGAYKYFLNNLSNVDMLSNSK